MNTCTRCKKTLADENFMKNGKMMKTCIRCREKSQSRNVNLEKNCKVSDVKDRLNDYIDNYFSGNKSFKKIIENSSFCSEKDEIIKENELLKQDQKIGIIPPIGGG